MVSGGDSEIEGEESRRRRASGRNLKLGGNPVCAIEEEAWCRLLERRGPYGEKIYAVANLWIFPHYSIDVCGWLCDIVGGRTVPGVYDDETRGVDRWRAGASCSCVAARSSESE